jgi:hypothetical protein
MQDGIYRSKVDAWIGLILTGLIIASLSLTFRELRAGTPLAAAPVVAALLLGIGLPLWVLLGTRYALTDQHLSIRSGPFRWRIRLDDIRGVTPTRSLVSGPALSLDRLRIDHGRRGSVLISPSDREAFLQRLAALRAAQ